MVAIFPISGDGGSGGRRQRGWGARSTTRWPDLVLLGPNLHMLGVPVPGRVAVVVRRSSGTTTEVVVEAYVLLCSIVVLHSLPF